MWDTKMAIVKVQPDAEMYLQDPWVEALAASLCGADLLSARLVCRRWHCLITPFVRTVVVSPRHWPRYKPGVYSEWMARALPAATTVQLLIDANRHPRTLHYSTLAATLEPLASNCKHLNSLAIVFRTSILPADGYNEAYFDAYVERWNAVADMVSQGLKPVLPIMGPRLTSLDLNAQCNLLVSLTPAVSLLTGLTKLRYTLSDHYTINRDDCRVLGNLTGLQSFYLRAWLPRPFNNDLRTALRQLTALTSLELEAVSISPDDSVMEDLSLVSHLTELAVLRVKGLGVHSLAGLTGLVKLREMTLTCCENLSLFAWLDLGALSALTSLNINAWAAYAPTEESSTVQREQSLEAAMTAVTAHGLLGQTPNAPAAAAALPEMPQAAGHAASPADVEAAPMVLDGQDQPQPHLGEGPGPGSGAAVAGAGLGHAAGSLAAGAAGNSLLLQGLPPLDTQAMVAAAGGPHGAPAPEGGQADHNGAGPSAFPWMSTLRSPEARGSHITCLRSLGIKVQNVRDLQFIGRLASLEELILAFDPMLPGHQYNVSLARFQAAVTAYEAGHQPAPAQPQPYQTPTQMLACICSLSTLVCLRRLDVYDTGGHMKLTQQQLEDFAQWFPRLMDLYYEGHISVNNMGRVHFPRIEHMDLINTQLQQHFIINLGYLPPRTAFLGLQNAVLVHPDSFPTTPLGGRRLAPVAEQAAAAMLGNGLHSLSLMRNVTWVDMMDCDMLQWAASCSMLTSLRLEFQAVGWDDQFRGAKTTRLAVLATAPQLRYLDVMFVDSSEASEGVLDTRLMIDLAAIPRLEELEVWTRGVDDWHDDISFLPLVRCTCLRSLKLEVMPHVHCVVVREVLTEALPQCRLRLVAQHMGSLTS